MLTPRRLRPGPRRWPRRSRQRSGTAAHRAHASRCAPGSRPPGRRIGAQVLHQRHHHIPRIGHVHPRASAQQAGTPPRKTHTGSPRPSATHSRHSQPAAYHQATPAPIPRPGNPPLQLLAHPMNTHHPGHRHALPPTQNRTSISPPYDHHPALRSTMASAMPCKSETPRQITDARRKPARDRTAIQHKVKSAKEGRPGKAGCITDDRTGEGAISVAADPKPSTLFTMWRSIRPASHLRALFHLACSFSCDESSVFDEEIVQKWSVCARVPRGGALGFTWK